MRNPILTRGSVLRLVSFYLFLTGALCLFQDQYIYQRAGEHIGDWTFVDSADWVTEVEFSSEDGTRLTAWFGTSEGPSRGAVLYFHGNGENVATQRHELVNLCQRLHFDCLIVDYRGFGRSEGTPSEAGLLMDARASMRQLNELSGTQPSDVVVLGRSLGGAVAANVASELGAKCLILHSTFTAMDDLVAGKLWFVPMRWLLWSRLPTIDWLREYHGPVFLAHGKQDKLVPYLHAERLYVASPSVRKKFLTQRTANHFNAANRDFFLELNRFLEAVCNQSMGEFR